MPLPNWDAVRQSLAAAIKAALPLQIARAGGGRIAGVGLHIDAYYGSAGLYLLPEAAAMKIPIRALNNIGDWPISTDWILAEDHAIAFAEHWGPWEKWFHEHLNDLSLEESEMKFQELLRVSREAMRDVERSRAFDGIRKTDNFKIIIAEHDEPNVDCVERYPVFVKTGEIRIHGK